MLDQRKHNVTGTKIKLKVTILLLCMCFVQWKHSIHCKGYNNRKFQLPGLHVKGNFRFDDWLYVYIEKGQIWESCIVIPGLRVLWTARAQQSLVSCPYWSWAQSLQTQSSTGSQNRSTWINWSIFKERSECFLKFKI